MKAIINIGLKDGVLDDQGKATHNTLNTLGFGDIINDLKVKKQIVIELNTIDHTKAKSTIIQMCEQLLVNMVIEDYTIDIED